MRRWLLAYTVCAVLTWYTMVREQEYSPLTASITAAAWPLYIGFHTLDELVDRDLQERICR